MYHFYIHFISILYHRLFFFSMKAAIAFSPQSQIETEDGYTIQMDHTPSAEAQNCLHGRHSEYELSRGTAEEELKGIHVTCCLKIHDQCRGESAVITGLYASCKSLKGNVGVPEGLSLSEMRQIEEGEGGAGAWYKKHFGEAAVDRCRLVICSRMFMHRPCFEVFVFCNILSTLYLLYFTLYLLYILYIWNGTVVEEY